MRKRSGTLRGERENKKKERDRLERGRGTDRDWVRGRERESERGSVYLRARNNIYIGAGGGF